MPTLFYWEVSSEKYFFKSRITWNIKVPVGKTNLNIQKLYYHRLKAINVSGKPWNYIPDVIVGYFLANRKNKESVSLKGPGNGFSAPPVSVSQKLTSCAFVPYWIVRKNAAKGCYLRNGFVSLENPEYRFLFSNLPRRPTHYLKESSNLEKSIYFQKQFKMQ